ncbi:MAG: hypothetical protein JWO83_2025, partial [Caulobacteraceae bacterium]|nr:hypothetical protein [Caulobacteraceae bacterium]
MAKVGNAHPHSSGARATTALRGRLMCSAGMAAALSGFPLGAVAAGSGGGGGALPTGGVVAAGAASISSPRAGALTVQQTGGRAVINWSSFSIGQGATVTFDNGSGATLNRVSTGGPISALDGTLSATGSVYLINPSGVIVGKTGVIKVGGTFAASTQNITDSGFLAGGSLTFNGGSNGAVVNYGRIGALGGDVVLIASRVENQGAIEAPNGAVGLLAGYQVLLKDRADADGHFAVKVGGAGTSATNAGTISAAAAELRAEQGNIYALAGNTTGVIRATEVSGAGGSIMLAAPGGSVEVSPGATLDSSANGAGNGGHILVDSASTIFSGVALARGGPLGGDGGLVETSGTRVNFDGAVINTLAPHGAAGRWLVDPTDLTVDSAAADTISVNLANTSVILQTTASGSSGPGTANPSGVGDINIIAPISWSSGSTLTLDAYHSLNITAPITVSGPGGVVMLTNDGGVGGTYNFGLGPAGFSGSLSFTGTSNTGQSLTINGQTMTLLYSMNDLQGVNASLAGDYALANSVDATSVSGWAPIGTDGAGNVQNQGFTGAFDGLGHTISNLTVNLPSTNFVGLFGYVSSGATIRNVGLVGGGVTGAAFVGGLVGYAQGSGAVFGTFSAAPVTGNSQVGGLVGHSEFTSIDSSYATGQVTGNGDRTGGLVGQDYSSITNSYAAGQVSGNGDGAGGLVGWQNSGVIAGDHATGAVSNNGNYTGGLIGVAQGGQLVSNVNASGAVSGGYYVGGLVGYSDNQIADASATGVVTSNNGTFVGGLVGQNNNSLTNVYATGSVSGGGTDSGGLLGYNQGAITTAYATGGVTANYDMIGGLIGENHAALTSVYATGGVSGRNRVGGLVGYSTNSIASAYATGVVTATGDQVGGLVGEMENNASLSDSYYSTGSVTGVTNVGGLVGYIVPGVTISNSHYDIDTILINGASQLTVGGLYHSQYNDWFSHGMTLSLANYGFTPDGSGSYTLSTVQDLKNFLGFAETAGLDW